MLADYHEWKKGDNEFLGQFFEYIRIINLNENYIKDTGMRDKRVVQIDYPIDAEGKFGYGHYIAINQNDLEKISIYPRVNIRPNVYGVIHIITSLDHVKEETLKFWQDKNKHEVDVILKRHNELTPIEIKFKTELKKDDFIGINKFIEKYNPTKAYLVNMNSQGKRGKITLLIPFSILNVKNHRSVE